MASSTPSRPEHIFSIPSGTVPLTVSIINTTTLLSITFDLLAGPPVSNSLPNLPPSPSFSFLLTHPTSNRRLLFDLGTRKDWATGLSYTSRSRIKDASFDAKARENVPEVLERHGVERSGIEAVIWSHWHWDHVGDPGEFPKETALIVGPGFKEAFLPGADEGDDESSTSPILKRDYEGRELRELSFDETGDDKIVRVGEFKALDYFGDGSFYILDSPGHAVGHLCGLARTSIGANGEEDTFIFMGGDAAHHGGEFRPCPPHVLLPEEIDPSPFGERTTKTLNTITSQSRPSTRSFCPGHLLQDLNTSRDVKPADGPLFYPNMGHDIPETIRTIEKMGVADGDPRVWVIFAHDDNVRNLLDGGEVIYAGEKGERGTSSGANWFPNNINDWKQKGWKEATRWAFLKDVEHGLVDIARREKG